MWRDNNATTIKLNLVRQCHD